MPKLGRYDSVAGKRCYYGLVGKGGKYFLGCDRKSAIEEAERLSNKHEVGVLVLQEVGVVRYVTEDEFQKIKKARR